MSRAVKAADALPQPGDRKPEDQRWSWAVCLSCNRGRWVFRSKELREAGFYRDCNKCAARKRAEQRILKGSNLEVPTGAIYHLGELVPGEPDKRYVTCPICNERHKESAASKKELKRRRGICTNCLPWTLLALKPEHYARRSSERDALYAKIWRIRKALEAGVAQPPRGQLLPSMPFWTLVKNFIKEFPDAAPRANKSKSAHVRYLTLFFEDKPIGEISLKDAEEFRGAMRNETSRWGEPHSESTVGRMVGTLKRIFSFAKEHGWVAHSPFPRGVRLYPRVRYKTNRIMTYDEDERLQVACGDDLDLKTSFIYMADTGTAQSAILNLCWTGVDFEGGTVKVPCGSVKMTPRLAAALRQLWESSGCCAEGPVFSRRRDQLYQSWEKVRGVAGAQRLTPTDIRRTCAWRMYEAQWRESQIAAALCCTLETVGALLVVDSETAESEINSPRFQKFIREQFGAPVNGNGQKDDNGKKRSGPEKGVYAYITWGTVEEAFKRVEGFPTQRKVAKALGVSEDGLRKWQQREKVNYEELKQRFINR